MDINALRYFVATAQFGSISRAAAHLRVAQPAVSRQIRKLEIDLGVRLLNRTAQGVSLTGEGEHLLARAEPVLQILKQTRAEVQSWDREPSGPVSVALITAVAPVVAPVLAARVREGLPKVRLRLSEGLSASIADGVLRGQYDLGLFHSDGELPLLAITHLLDEPMFLIGPGDDEPEKSGDIGLRSLADYPLLLPEPPNPLRRLIDTMTEERGVALDFRETVNSTAMIKSMVAAGLGYTIQGYSFFHEEALRGDTRFKARRIKGMMRNWSLGSLTDRPAVSAVSAVAEVLRDVARGLAGAQRW